MNRDTFEKATLIRKEINETASKIALISQTFERSFYRPGFAKTASGTNFAGIGIFQKDMDGRVCVVGGNAHRIDEDIVEEAVKKMLARLEEKKAKLEKEFAGLWSSSSTAKPNVSKCTAGRGTERRWNNNSTRDCKS